MTEIYANIIVYFIKYIVAYALLFIIIPCFIFTNIKSDIVKSIVSNYIKMTFWIIIFGYLSILLKLFEFITFFIIVVICISYKYFKRSVTAGNVQMDMKDDLQILVINHVDNIERIENKFFRYIARKVSDISSDISSYFGNIWSVLSFIMLCVVFGYASYLCFYDSFTSVAPTANESYTTLAWMKYLENRILFNDNIYPQGFYIVLETLQKIFHIDHLYIVNFTGALNNILITFGMYYFVSKLSKDKTVGIISAIIYSILGSMFINPSVLHTVANPQQFAMIFLFPVLYFFHEYIRKSKREDFFVAFFGSLIIGLVHPLAFIFLAIGLVTLFVANILRDFKDTIFKAFETFTIIFIATLVAVLPIGIGLLLKKNFSITAINLILENDMFIKMPEIRLFDYIGMASLAIIFLNLLFDIPKKNVFIKKMWIFLFGTFSFLFYIYGGVLTHSKYLNQGSNTLWALLIPVVIAFAFLALFDALKIMFRFNYIGHIACYLTILSVLYYLPQNPIISDKKEYNSSVVQYLKISKTFRPTQWMIVSWQEGYSLALGSGFHMLIDDFIDSYSPENKKLININDNYKELRTEDLFIFYEKNIFYNKTVDLGYYRYKSAMKPKIFEWINKYQENHHNISLFYSDENIEVWQIHQLLDKEEIRTRIWE